MFDKNCIITNCYVNYILKNAAISAVFYIVLEWCAHWYMIFTVFIYMPPKITDIRINSSNATVKCRKNHESSVIKKTLRNRGFFMCLYIFEQQHLRDGFL